MTSGGRTPARLATRSVAGRGADLSITKSAAPASRPRAINTVRLATVTQLKLPPTPSPPSNSVRIRLLVPSLPPSSPSALTRLPLDFTTPPNFLALGKLVAYSLTSTSHTRATMVCRRLSLLFGHPMGAQPFPMGHFHPHHGPRMLPSLACLRLLFNRALTELHPGSPCTEPWPRLRASAGVGTRLM
jgi:hypothetical protein